MKKFESLDILKKIEIAEKYTAETGDNTNIVNGLTKESEIWLKNYFDKIAEKDAKVAQMLIHNMDFSLLRAQKTLLINMQSKKSITTAEWNVLEGMINLLDTIQDLACDEYDHDPNDIFNFTNEVDENQKLSLAECRKIVNKY